ncbi:hypothetical protein DERF_014344 [Dermatophagoides farinae]|uniref:CWH43-like N-terminal domain-containing protein n=2 Tax=Dermatophagoides farinae TaxID=6954 RepID=A0A922HM16_DERFA|nr:hypothetical protein HUG17_6789 [Dermatophagoides farinae]KAH9493605.1 hypothetical protein DERF_014344 [Dermatophagoides farinae]
MNENSCKFFDFERLIRRFEPNLWLFPFTGGLLLFITLISCYLITSYTRGYPLVWLVSDVGAASPVAGYFSQSLDMISFFFAISGYLRSKQVEYYLTRIIPRSENRQINNLDMIRILHEKNYQSFCCCILSSIGFIILGNFNSVDHLYEHGVGCFFMFTTIPFLISQTFIANKLYECDQIESRPITLTIVTYTVTIGWPLTTAIFFLSLWVHGSLFVWLDANLRLDWPSDAPSFLWFRTGIIMEWVVIMNYSPTLLVLANRMRLFKHWNRIVY